MEWLVNRHPSSSMWFYSCPCSWRAKKKTCLTRKCFNNHSWPGAVTKRSICYIGCANMAHVLTCNRIKKSFYRSGCIAFTDKSISLRMLYSAHAQNLWTGSEEPSFSKSHRWNEWWYTVYPSELCINHEYYIVLHAPTFQLIWIRIPEFLMSASCIELLLSIFKVYEDDEHRAENSSMESWLIVLSLTIESVSLLY